MSRKKTIATVGEMLVEFVSHDRNCALEKISDYSGPYPSGAPAIFLDQVARMGAPTEMIGGVGDDGFGLSVLNRLKEDGVGTDGVTVSPNLSTGVAFVS
jgi:sugar/nucleoside kinase (ribokinase family)